MNCRCAALGLSLLGWLSLLLQAGPELHANASARFRLERQGSAFRDVSRGYRDMCATVSNRIWDEPNGRRIKFDSAGKPGVAIVIPIR